jgi:membrane fusion protein (multidrug efflux system)
MAHPFSRSLRQLTRDGSGRHHALIGIALALAALWGLWFCFASISVYEVSGSARLEVARQAHAVESPLPGRVVRNLLALGTPVKQGDVLVELDAATERLALAEVNARTAGAGAQVEALRAELEAEGEARRTDQEGTLSALEEARARYQEAETGANLAADEARRLDELHAGGHVTEMDWVRARAEARRKRAAADALRLEATRRHWDRRTGQTDRQARIAEVRRQVALLEGELRTGQATAERLRHEIEQRTVRAPIGGRLGEIADLPPGSFVRQGERLCAVVPPGGLRVVAEFLPADALGRIRPGQSGRLRLDGFPWTQYGTAAATVTSVATEPVGGHVRAELVLTTDAGSHLPLEHGLPGTVEVAVERVTPAALVLRTIGRALAGPAGGQR